MSDEKLAALLKNAQTDLKAGRLDTAAAGCARIREADAHSFEAWNLGGLIAFQQHHYAEATKLLRHAVKLDPLSAQALTRLALAQNALGNVLAAEASLRNALRLQPHFSEAQIHLGTLLTQLGRFPEAEMLLRGATAARPTCAEGWDRLGQLLTMTAHLEEAEGCFVRATEARPEFANAWHHRGVAALLALRPPDALGFHTRALELCPHHPQALFSRGQAFQACHLIDDALADFDEQLERHPEHHAARSGRLFARLHCESVTREELFAEYLAYGHAVAAVGPESWPNSPEPGRRLRVAFLSPDLRRHPVAAFVEPLIRHLDRSRFEVFLYHDHIVNDEVSARLRDLADTWRHFGGRSDAIVEARIRADRPDLLVDLAGHAPNNRLPLLARRLAPVQVSYLGYPATTGVAAMDFRFTDAVADPCGPEDAFFTERLVRFASTAWVYAPPAEAPAVAPGPTQESPVTFGSFNALAKINDATLRLWAEVLAATPRSRLFLKSDGIDAYALTQRLAALGFDLRRVSLYPRTPSLADHLATYAQVDIALDPFPYSGAATVCEALWMGVPVVTLGGDRHSSRVGASLLNAVGYPEWIASSQPDYIRIASGLAAERSALATRRGQLREKMAASPLLDHLGQASRFGDALTTAWSDWCRRSVPAVCSAA